MELKNKRTTTTPTNSPKTTSRLGMFEVLSELYGPENNSIQTLKVGRPKSSMLFTIVGEAVDIGCIVEKSENVNGRIKEEAFYPVAQNLQESLHYDLRPIRFHLGVDTNGAYYLIPQKMANYSGFTNSWFESMEECIAPAREGWVTLRADLIDNCYKVNCVTINTPKPLNFPDIADELDKALSNNFITDDTHPILEKLNLRELIKEGLELVEGG